MIELFEWFMIISVIFIVVIVLDDYETRIRNLERKA